MITCVEGTKRSQDKIRILLVFCLIFFGPLFRVCFDHIENFFLINHLGHIMFGKVRVFKVLPSVTKIKSPFLYVAMNSCLVWWSHEAFKVCIVMINMGFPWLSFL